MASDSQRVVENVLKQSALLEKNFKTIEVFKDVDVEIDPGALLAFDSNPIDVKDFGKNPGLFLKSMTRDNTQLLFNSLWQLPAERVDQTIVVKLPTPTTKLPREKHVPKDTLPTRWEQYSRVKGIQNKKKSRTVYDEDQKKWIPRWGYGSKNDASKEWVVEVPDNVDPNTDMFAEKKDKKKERVAKNEFQRLRNIARAQKLKVPGQGLKPKAITTKPQVSMAIHAAKHSTASIGKFERTLPKEKFTKQMGNKRKFDSLTGDINKERSREITILDNLNRKKSKLDVTKAVNKEIQEENVEGRSKKGGRSVKKSAKALPKSSKRKKTGAKGKKGKRR